MARDLLDAVAMDERYVRKTDPYNTSREAPGVAERESPSIELFRKRRLVNEGRPERQRRQKFEILDYRPGIEGCDPYNNPYAGK